MTVSTMHPGMAAVRLAYAALRVRCLMARPDEADYINGLYGSWAARLDQIEGYPAHREPYIALLIRELQHPEASVMEWLDAFPSAIDDEPNKAPETPAPDSEEEPE